MTLTFNSEVGTGVKVEVNKGHVNNFSLNTHPKVDKKEWESSSLLGIKGGKGFPLGRPVGILRWSAAEKDLCPLTINCWPEEEGNGNMTVAIEFELANSNLELTDVNIFIPLGTTDAPKMGEVDGQFKHNSRDGVLLWHSGVVNEGNSSGSMEFSVGGNDASSFFPIQVQFKCEKLYCGIEVTAVEDQNGAVDYEIRKSLSPDNYIVS